jgi:hypothetical protein
MISQRYVFAAVLGLAAAIETVPSFGDDRCSGVTVTEVRSLLTLPNQIRRLLPSDTHGLDGIADRGGRFNATDVVVDQDVPMRRFILAAVGTTCTVIAVEKGGRAHYFELTEYRLTATGWASHRRDAVFQEPKSASDLLTVQGRHLNAG